MQNNLPKIFIQHQDRYTSIKYVGKYISTLFKHEVEKRYVFVSECSSIFERFIQTIRKTTITAFASENFEKKKVAGLQVTKGTRDLFGRLLFLPAITGIDSEGVFFLSCSPGASTFCIP